MQDACKLSTRESGKGIPESGEVPLGSLQDGQGLVLPAHESQSLRETVEIAEIDVVGAPPRGEEAGAVTPLFLRSVAGLVIPVGEYAIGGAVDPLPIGVLVRPRQSDPEVGRLR